MALRVPQSGGPQLFKEGYKNLQGLEEVILRNIQATKEMSEITRTSFGPYGRNKMVVNHLDKLFVTNDAATIIRELEVVHPAAKLLVMASQQQEAEAGDGTNYVIILASELLQRAEPLLRMGLHPSEIARGYELAMDEALEQLDTLAVDEVKVWSEQSELLKAVRTAVASKQYGQEHVLAPLVAEAVQASMPRDATRFSVDNVRVVKIMGGGLAQSRVVHGMVLPQAPETVCHNAQFARVAVFSCPVDMGQTETKGTVLLHNANEMLDYTKGEEAQMEQAVRELHDANVKVVVCGSGVGDLAIHYLNRFDMIVVRCPSKFELRRLCRVVGANPLARFGVPTPEEMGYCDEVRTDEIGGDRVTILRQWSASELASRPSADRPAFADRIQRSPLVTVVLRGATVNALDDAERAVDDGVNVIKSLTKDARLVPGACATEMELSRRVQERAEQTPGINQHAMKAFGQALQIFARTLGDNVGVDSTALVAKLIAAHHASASDGLVGPSIGIDVECENEPRVLDAKEAGILDPLSVKQWAIRYAVQAALTVLQVDQIVMAKTAGGPKLPKQQGNWDDQD
ncbi:T-complex protein 1 subunit theta [Coemansia sp. RSA 2167]|nr:T-complex protein 1 subunit theta [Coemansia sp. RSA 1591]KAJ1757873.1 T-complex protein 1 subunit theta [Coemansia sp. RSA 1752]KAJ1780211.1 T-complex protein 1 subunit theta [Coemansia sp. RSA 1824]KAJ1784797.1 T-complex protein 1 subunit theta [Coemansia sp. RSA 1938]KAJ1786120.1 T-complex protein 1 subunit theta [Coemansia sp. RSA 2167]KAJ2147823.1 T-complex protein 1 subunit theta [Coemansia sp. RSA 564]KAJ2409443.1 T-complex protein 1 subunit theta [Coemansia sp. RSA 2526]KAJ2720784